MMRVDAIELIAPMGTSVDVGLGASEVSRALDVTCEVELTVLGVRLGTLLVVDSLADALLLATGVLAKDSEEPSGETVTVLNTAGVSEKTLGTVDLVLGTGNETLEMLGTLAVDDASEMVL